MHHLFHGPNQASPTSCRGIQPKQSSKSRGYASLRSRRSTASRTQTCAADDARQPAAERHADRMSITAKDDRADSRHGVDCRSPISLKRYWNCIAAQYCVARAGGAECPASATNLIDFEVLRWWRGRYGGLNKRESSRDIAAFARLSENWFRLGREMLSWHSRYGIVT